MLDTLLHIGKTLRSAGRMKHHRFIKPAPLEDKKTKVTYFQLPVRADFSFDFDGITSITDEDFIRNALYYLTFKSGEADSLVKYIFGDICWGRDKKGKEMGYYRMRNEAITNLFGVSSFYRGKEDAKVFNGTVIERFRDSFEPHVHRIESLLEEHGQEQFAFLHFDFAGKHWYEFEDEMQAINQKFLADLLETQENQYVLKNFLYKTLASGASQAPGFSNKNLHKTKAFKTHDEVLDLLYAIDYSKKALITERDIKIIVLPKGEHVEAAQIENFFERRNFEVQDQAEAQLNEANEAASSVIDQSNFFDSIFENVLANSAASITQYDFVFSKKGGSASTPDVDMLEVAGIERSFLADLGKRVVEIRRPLLKKRNELHPKRPKEFAFLDIRKAFLNILGDVTSDKKKYQSHLFKVLPQIYTGTYYFDPVLLPAFIEKTELNVRNGQPNFNLMRFDYYFLTHILNSDGEKQMEEMKKSQSYQAGLLLGRMAQPLNRKIASFEKNYVGLLSRRISDRQGLIKFANFINEKLAIHDVAYPNLKQSFVALADLISNMRDKDYHKNSCAFGFFESYFSRYETPETANANLQTKDALAMSETNQ